MLVETRAYFTLIQRIVLVLLESKLLKTGYGYIPLRPSRTGEGENGNRSRGWPGPSSRQSPQEKVRPGTGRETGLGHDPPTECLLHRSALYET